MQAAISFPWTSAFDAEGSGTPKVDSDSQQAAAPVREQAAALAAAAADAAAAEAAARGEAPISDEQLEQAVQWLVTGLLDRLQEVARLHAHELVHWSASAH